MIADIPLFVSPKISNLSGRCRRKSSSLFSRILPICAANDPAFTAMFSSGARMPNSSKKILFNRSS